MRKPAKSSLDRMLAGICGLCPLCRQARRRRQGTALAIVSRIEASLCPFCRAYERVHGVKAHEKPGRQSE